MIETQSTDKNINVIVIRVKNEKYLIEVSKVKEIYVPQDKIVPVPLAEDFIAGIIDVRGDIYPILSLRKKIYSNENIPHMDKDTRILLLEYEKLNISIMVDEVIGVKNISSSSFNQGNPIIETDLDFEFIKSVTVIDGGTYILLDIGAFIDSFNIDLSATKKPFTRSRPKKKVKKKEPKIDIETDKPQPLKTSFSESYGMKGELSELEDKIELSPEQEDMLKEIGNIGSGNAVTALSSLVKKKINIDLTNVGIVSFDNLTEQFGGPMEKVCGIFSQIEETPQSTIFQAFELKPLVRMVNSLIGPESKINPEDVSSKSDLDDITVSTISEMGNILAGHYASAMADLLGKKMMIGVPEFAVSDVNALGKFLSKELKTIHTYVVIIRTSIKVVDYELNGVFLFIPDMDTLYDFFDTLGIEYKPKDTIKSSSKESVDKDQIQLSELQRDALQEIGNIGSGNAANALAKMVSKKGDD